MTSSVCGNPYNVTTVVMYCKSNRYSYKEERAGATLGYKKYWGTSRLVSRTGCLRTAAGAARKVLKLIAMPSATSITAATFPKSSGQSP